MRLRLPPLGSILFALTTCAFGLPACRTVIAPPPAATKQCPSEPPASVEPQPELAPSCGLPLDLKRPEWPTRLPSTHSEEREPTPSGAVSLAVLPDTQYYSLCGYPHLERQAAYLATTAAQRNLAAILSLGDLTDRNSEEEWQFVKDSLAPIPESLPVLLTTGNHDLGQRGSADSRESLISSYFPMTWANRNGALRQVKTLGNIENAFYSINVGKFQLGVLMLGWSPERSTVDWANQVLRQFSDHRVIVVTHAYLYDDGSRYDYQRRGDTQNWNPLEYQTANGEFSSDPSHDGEMLWNSLVRLHANVFLVLSGHVLGQGSGRLTSVGDSGNLVHQLLVNYQMLDEGGLGYLRLIEILPDGRTLHLKTYSPSLGLYSYAASQDFRLDIEPPLFRPNPVDQTPESKGGASAPAAP